MEKELNRYCALCSSPELTEIENEMYNRCIPHFDNVTKLTEEVKLCCKAINAKISILKSEKIKLFVDTVSVDDLQLHFKEHKDKRGKIHLLDKFKPGHELRKRLIVCNHFKGLARYYTPKVGDVVRAKVGNKDYREGVVLQKLDIKQNSDISDDSDSDDSSLLGGAVHEYLISFADDSDRVMKLESIEPYRSTVISSVKSALKVFRNS